jgi:hypothetical protein
MLLAARSANAAVVLGVLEQPQCKESSEVAVRVLFAKKESAWQALTEAGSAEGLLAQEMAWTVALDGRSLGEIRTADPGFNTPYEWTYPRDRLLKVAPSPSAPDAANKRHQFGGWCAVPKRRPLVVVSSGGGVTDPDTWRPHTATASSLERMFTTFKARAGPADICPGQSESRVSFVYGPGDIEVLSSYRDRQGRFLISLRIERPKEPDMCDGPIDSAWDSHTFVVTSTNVGYIGQGLELVDAGDYDMDGHSELLFWSSAYNRDGYVLFPSNLAATPTTFQWNYH